MTTDADHLRALEAKLDLIRDRVRGVALGYSPGLLLTGEGGGGKTYAVEGTLRALDADYRLTNSRLSGRALFELLRDQPAAVHVLDDCETLLADKNAVGVLRSALWGLPGEDGRQKRVVVWQVAKVREEFDFKGGVILVGNSRPHDGPEMRAVMTRVPVVSYDPTDEELGAFMRRLAQGGHRHGRDHLPAHKCLEVVEEVLARSQKAGRKLDLRLYVNGCTDRLQYEAGNATNHWLNLLESRLQQRVLAPKERVESQAERSARELAVAGEVAPLPPVERLAQWVERTGKSRAALYRRLEELSQKSHC